MKPNEFETQIRVRYQETDQMGVVYYANYLVWFEVARTEHLRAHGIRYKDIEARGSYLMVAAINCQYKSPAKYDDLVRIFTAISDIKNSSLKFVYKVYVDDRLIATGDSLHVFTNNSRKPVKIPEELRSKFS